KKMVQKVGLYLLLLFIFATLISTASTSRILKESIDEISIYDLTAQIDESDVEVARRMDMADYHYRPTKGRPKPKHN
ncbi:hypothetical protein EJD97_011218, partial [Solanum chilense]